MHVQLLFARGMRTICRDSVARDHCVRQVAEVRATSSIPRSPSDVLVEERPLQTVENPDPSRAEVANSLTVLALQVTSFERLHSRRGWIQSSGKTGEVRGFMQ